MKLEIKDGEFMVLGGPSRLREGKKLKALAIDRWPGEISSGFDHHRRPGVVKRPPPNDRDIAWYSRTTRFLYPQHDR